jgi:hypothetical protein
MTARRSREVPSGTVGGRIACANTPPSIAASQIAMAVVASPTMSGTICVVEPATSNPSRASSSRRMPGVRLQLVDARGLLGEQLERGERAAATVGGSAVEKISGRRCWSGSRRQRAARGERAVGAEGLAERADDHVDLASRPASATAPRRRARARRSVRLVDDQAQPVGVGEVEQLGQRRDVAVHREHRVGDDHAAGRRGPRDLPGEVLDVAVAVHGGARARQDGSHR